MDGPRCESSWLRCNSRWIIGKKRCTSSWNCHCSHLDWTICTYIRALIDTDWIGLLKRCKLTLLKLRDCADASPPLDRIEYRGLRRKTTSLKANFTHENQEPWLWNLWEPKRKCPKVVPRHFQSHAGWSRTLYCSVRSCVTGPSAKWYFNEFLFMTK